MTMVDDGDPGHQLLEAVRTLNGLNLAVSDTVADTILATIGLTVTTVVGFANVDAVRVLGHSAGYFATRSLALACPVHRRLRPAGRPSPPAGLTPEVRHLGDLSPACRRGRILSGQ